MADQPSNPQFRRYWNAEGVADWLAHRRRLDEMFQPLHDAVLAALDPQPGERVLDVGCGPGALTCDVAARVGAGGAAVGVDISSVFVDVARREAAALGRPARFVLADAQDADLEELAPLDAWTSRLGVMFFDHPVRAFDRLCGLLGSGGRVAFVCWAPLAQNPWMGVAMGAMAACLPPSPSPDGGVDPWAFGELHRLQDLLATTDLHDVHVQTVDFEVVLGRRGATEVVRWLTSLDAVAPMLAVLDEEGAAAARAAAIDALQPHEREGVVRLPAAARLVTARR